MTHESTQSLSSYYILATSTRADERTRVIKDGDSFGVFDPGGTIRHAGQGELGLYHDGTRFLSQLEIGLERHRPLLLGSTVRQDDVLIVDLANPDMAYDGNVLVRDTIHVFAKSFLWDRAWYARLRLRSYAREPLALELSLLFAADYTDIFEVRGLDRVRRGRYLDPVVAPDHVVLAYEGLDRVTRATRLGFAPVPALLTASRASFQLRLDALGEATIELRVGFEIDGDASPALGFEAALEDARTRRDQRWRASARIETTSTRFDDWVDRSTSDLRMMITRTPHGEYPYAGVPWYSTAFGRDGILTAYEALWLDPELARGVLGFLAATQATHASAEQDAEPGKIIHEVRGGEMAALGEIPFGRYYGALDSTPLFVMLAGAYWRRTDDRALIEAIWPAIEQALAWIDVHGDLDGDGFVEYARRSSTGLTSQGWKDSVDSISHRDGALAEGPIAPCEVQGYVYAARLAGAALARMRGLDDLAAELEHQADALRERFERTYWCEDLGTYALALDGDKRRCEVISSNAGHCLFTGIAAPARARRVIESLLGDGSFSGWGIRTLDASAARYNPLSYHNGSVWPHDNAIISMGMARYGHKAATAQILSGLFDASIQFDLGRMPELFCGFRRREHEGPTRYPVACAPQAWAAGAVFLLLQACLGLDVDAVRGRIVFDRPVLPQSLRRVSVRNLRVGEASTDLVLERHASDVGVHLEHRAGDVELLIVK